MQSLLVLSYLLVDMNVGNARMALIRRFCFTLWDGLVEACLVRNAHRQGPAG
jgi:hypothetical protein